MANYGCRIFTDIKRPEQALLEKFKKLPVANIDDCMGRIAAVDESIKPVNKAKVIGPAFTVKAPEGDNLMFHKALDLAKPGDVLVIAAGGSMNRSLCGEIMVRYAILKGLGGFVIDGCIRDIEEISNIDTFPVYCKGVTPNGPYKNGPGEINVPVSFGGKIICPGDILIGDEDGLIIVKQEEAEELIAKTEKINANETEVFANLAKGIGMNRAWIDKKLSEIGCEIIDGIY